MNYHEKQKDKKSFKSSIKRFNSLFEIDTNLYSAYFYIPPSTAKNPIKVKYSEQIIAKSGTYNIDYDENHHIVGFEIVNGENLDLKALNIQDVPKIIKEQVDGNK